MVAIISGQYLGLKANSENQISPNGNASLGQGRESVFVNSSTGNVYIQGRDEYLSTIGLDLPITRIYNSLGNFDGDNADQWQMSIVRRLRIISGTTAAETRIFRSNGDGAEIEFFYDSITNTYVSKSGSGAHESIKSNPDTVSGGYFWNDGNVQVQEYYDADGYLKYIEDAGQRRLSFEYKSVNNTTVLDRILDGAGQATYFDYQAGSVANHANLASVKTFVTDYMVKAGQTWGDIAAELYGVAVTDSVFAAALQASFPVGTTLSAGLVLHDMPIQIASVELKHQEVQYYYDDLDRLSQVVVDLTPLDRTFNLQTNAQGLYQNINGDTYVTTYTYWGNTNQIRYIDQGDGAHAEFEYYDDGRLWRYKLGDNAWTTFTYGAPPINPTTPPPSPGPGPAPGPAPSPSVALLDGEQVFATGLPVDSSIVDVPDTTYGASVWNADLGVVTQTNNTQASEPASAIEKRGSVLYVNSSSWTDYTYSVTLNSTDIDDIGLVFRAKDATNYYRFSMNNQTGYRRLVKVENDVFTELWSDKVAYKIGFDYQVKISAIGHDIKVFVNNQELVSVYDANAYLSGGVGLYVDGNTGAKFSNIAVYSTSASAPVTSTPVPGVMLDQTADHFTDSVAANWQVVDDSVANGPSDWRVVNGVVTQASDVGVLNDSSVERPGSYFLYNKGANWSDYTLQLNMTSSDDDAMGVMFRVQDANNYYRFSMDRQNQTVRLTKVSNGVFTDLQTKSLFYVVGQDYDLRIKAIGNHIVVSSGDAEIFNYTDTNAPILSGSIAYYMASNQGGFSGLKVYQGDVSLPNVFPANPSGLLLDGASYFSNGITLANEIVEVVDTTYGTSNWTAVGGQLMQDSNIQANESSTAIEKRGTVLHVANSSSWTDYTFNTTINSGDNDTIGLVFRAKDATNYYRFSMDRQVGYRRLVKVENDVFTALWSDSVAYSSNTDYKVSIHAIGDTITIDINGVQIASYVDAQAYLSGGVGFYTDGNVGSIFKGISVVDETPVLTTLSTSVTTPTLNTTDLQIIDNPDVIGYTQVTDPTGNIMQYGIDAQGRLIVEKTFFSDGSLEKIEYRYDGDGNIAKTIDGRGNETIYSYDVAGNLVQVQDAMGNTSEYAYLNNLVSIKTDYTVADPDMTNTVMEASGALHTRYIYDDMNRLRFVIGPEGRVSETNYYATGSSAGQVEYTRDFLDLYTNFNFLVADQVPSVDDINAWISTDVVNLSRTIRTDYSYDFRGNLSSKTQYADAGNLTGESFVTHYIYDHAGRLLETIDPHGASVNVSTYLTEYVYDGLGRILESRLPVDGVNQEITKYDYKLNGSQYIVDQITNTGNGADLLVQESTYNDAGEMILSDSYEQQTPDTILGQTQFFYDNAGRLRYTKKLLSYKLDVNGYRINEQYAENFIVYDQKGRVEATIDPMGLLSRNFYDTNDKVVQTIQYYMDPTDKTAPSSGTYIDYASLLIDINGNPIENVSVSDLLKDRVENSNDRVTYYIHDKANRLVYQISEEYDAGGVVKQYVSETRYDGMNRIIETIAYAKALDATSNVAANATSADIHPIADDPTQLQKNDRHQHFYYDAIGNKIGFVDAEDYATEWKFNGLGQQTTEIRYADRVGISLENNFSVIVDALKVAPNIGGAIHSFNVYNGRGQLAASLQERGKVSIVDSTNAPVAGGIGDYYLTTFQYDDLNQEGHIATTTRYSQLVTSAQVNDVINGNLSLAAIKPVTTATDANGIEIKNRISVQYFDGQNRLLKQIDDNNSVTENHYDVAGKLVRVDRYAIAQGLPNNHIDQRTVLTKFDSKGRVARTLSAEGELALRDLAVDATPSEIEKVWTSYGVTYHYDEGNRKTSEVDAWGNARYFYYDNNDRLRFEINGDGSFLETQYNVFGEVNARFVPKFKISQSVYSGLKGGKALDTLNTLLYTVNAQLLSVPPQSEYSYTNRGLLSVSIVGGEARTAYLYNAFGEVNITHNATADYVANEPNNNHYFETNYDRRGSILSNIEYYSSLDNTINVSRSETTSYDAFARNKSQQDAKGNESLFFYDKLGRIISTEYPKTSADINLSASTLKNVYDAFSNVLVTEDAMGNQTRSSYEQLDVNGSAVTAFSTPTQRLTVVSPENIQIVTEQNVHGETIKFFDGNGFETTYDFDVNGNLYEKRVDGVVIESNNYNNPGSITSPSEYMRLYESTDGNGNVIRYTYDAANRIQYKIVDPGGLNIVTKYEYFVDGIDAIEYSAFGTVEQIKTTKTFNDDGSIKEIVVGEGAGAKYTRYSYQYNGLLSSVAEFIGVQNENYGSYTRFEYDGYNRKIRDLKTSCLSLANSNYEIVTEYHYDDNDNIVATVDPNGNIIRAVFNERNEKIFEIDALGAITKYEYDQSGRLSDKFSYSELLTHYAALGIDGFRALPVKLSFTEVTAIYDQYMTASVFSGKIRHEIYMYDGVNRIITKKVGEYLYGLWKTLTPQQVAANIDSSYITASYTYDKNGSLIHEITYADNANKASLDNRQIYKFYDALNRNVYNIDALGFVTQTYFDSVGNVVRSTKYENPIDIASLGISLLTTAQAGAGSQKIVLNTIEQAVDAAQQSNLVEVVLTGSTGAKVEKLIGDDGAIYVIWETNSQLVMSAKKGLAAWTIPIVVLDNLTSPLSSWGAYIGNGDSILVVYSSAEFPNLSGVTIDSTNLQVSDSILFSTNEASNIVINEYGSKHAAISWIESVIDPNGNTAFDAHIAVLDPYFNVTRELPSVVLPLNVNIGLTTFRLLDNGDAVFTSKNGSELAVYYYDLSADSWSNEYNVINVNQINSSKIYESVNGDVFVGLSDASVSKFYGLTRKAGLWGLFELTTQNSQFDSFVDIDGSFHVIVSEAGILVDHYKNPQSATWSATSLLGSMISAPGLNSNDISQTQQGISQAYSPKIVQTSDYEWDIYWILNKGTVPNQICSIQKGKYLAGKWYYLGEIATEHSYLETLNVVGDPHNSYLVWDSSSISKKFYNIVDKNKNHSEIYSYDEAGRLLYMVDAMGAVSKYEYNEYGKLIKNIKFATLMDFDFLLSKTAAEIRYQIEKHISQLSSFADNVEYVTYDSLEREKYRVDSRGYVTETIYGNGTLLTTLGNSLLDKVVRLYHNSININDISINSSVSLNDQIQGLLVESDLDLVITSNYDSADRLTHIVTSSGKVGGESDHEYNYYDLNGNKVAYFKATSDGDIVNYYRFDEKNRLLRSIDAEGYVKDSYYDGFGNVISKVEYVNPVVMPAYVSRYWAYFDKLAPGSENFTPNSDVVTGDRYWGYKYDVFGRLTVESTPLSVYRVETTNFERSVSTIYTYDNFGNLTETIQGRKNFDFGGFANPERLLVRSYDVLNRIKREYSAIDNGGQLEAYAEYNYDAYGNQISIADPRAYELAETDSEWALAFRKNLGYVDPVDGHVLLTANQELTQIDKQSLKRLFTTAQEFDLNNRKISTNLPFAPTMDNETDSGKISVKYDAFGNIVSSTDAKGSTLRFYYDNGNYIFRKQDANGVVTEYARNRKGDVTKEVILNDTYNRFIQNSEILYTNEIEETPLIPSASFLTSKFSGLFPEKKLLVIRFTYSEQLILTGANGVEPNDNDTIKLHLSYQLTSGLNRVRDLEFRYVDVKNNLSFELDLEDASYGITLQQIQFSLKTALKHTKYNYDEFGRKIRETDSAGLTIKYDYDRNGNLIRKTDKDNVETSYSYDKLGRKTREINPGTTQAGIGKWQSALLLNSYAFEASSRHDPQSVFISQSEALYFRGGVATNYDLLENRITSTTIINVQPDEGDVLANGEGEVLAAEIQPSGVVNLAYYSKQTGWQYTSLSSFVTTDISMTTLKDGGFVVAAFDGTSTHLYFYDATNNMLDAKGIDLLSSAGVVSLLQFKVQSVIDNTILISATVDTGANTSKILISRFSLNGQAQVSQVEYSSPFVKYRLINIGFDERGHYYITYTMSSFNSLGNGYAMVMVDQRSLFIWAASNTLASTTLFYNAGGYDVEPIEIEAVVSRDGKTFVAALWSNGRTQWTRVNRDGTEDVRYSGSWGGTSTFEMISSIHLSKNSDDLISLYTDGPSSYLFQFSSDDFLLDSNEKAINYQAANLVKSFASTNGVKSKVTTSYDGELLIYNDRGLITYLQSPIEKTVRTSLSQSETYFGFLDSPVSVKYDKLGREVEKTYPEQSFEYSNLHINKLAPVDIVPVRTYEKKFYDVFNNLVGETTTRGYSRVYEYDIKGNQIAKKDEDNFIHLYSYDAAGNLFQQKDLLSAFPHAFTWQQATIGNVRKAAFSSYAYTGKEYLYDGRNRKVSEKSLLNEKLYLQNQNSGIRESVNSDKFYVYDGADNLLSTYVMFERFSTSWYDNENRKIAELDADGYLQTWDYDTKGNMSRYTRYAGQINVIGGETLTQLIAAVDLPNENRVTEFTYDYKNQLIEERVKDVEIYDPSSNTNILQDAVTRIYYDKNGYKNRVINPLGEDVIYINDRYGNILEKRDKYFTNSDGITGRRTTKHWYNYQKNEIFESQGFYTDLSGFVVDTFSDAAGDYYNNAKYLYNDYGLKRAEITDNKSGYRYFYYDVAGNLVAKEDGVTDDQSRYNLTRYFYDGLNREIVRTNPTSVIKTATGTSGGNWEFNITSYGGNNRILQKGLLNNGAFTWQPYVTSIDQELSTLNSSSDNYFSDYLQEYFEYDSLGNLVKTNTKTGVSRVYYYDVAGNAVKEVTSPNIDLSNPNITPDTLAVELEDPTLRDNYTVKASYYDKRGNLVEIDNQTQDLSDSLKNEAQYNEELQALTDVNGNPVVDQNGNPVFSPVQIALTYDSARISMSPDRILEATEKRTRTKHYKNLSFSWGDWGYDKLKVKGPRLSDFLGYLGKVTVAANGVPLRGGEQTFHVEQAPGSMTLVYQDIDSPTSAQIAVLGRYSLQDDTKKTNPQHSWEEITSYYGYKLPSYIHFQNSVDPQAAAQLNGTAIFELRYRVVSDAAVFDKNNPPNWDSLNVAGSVVELSLQHKIWDWQAELKNLGHQIAPNDAIEFYYKVYDSSDTTNVIGSMRGLITKLQDGGRSAEYTYTQAAYDVINSLDLTVYKIYQRENNLELNVVQKQIFNAFGEVIREVRPSSDGVTEQVTDFKYSKLGKVLEKIDPDALVTNIDATQKTIRPTTVYGYDMLGREIMTANANAVDESNTSGIPIAPENRVIKTYNGDFLSKVSLPESAEELYFYDQHGNNVYRDQLNSIDANYIRKYRREAYEYNRYGRVTKKYATASYNYVSNVASQNVTGPTYFEDYTYRGVDQLLSSHVSSAYPQGLFYVYDSQDRLLYTYAGDPALLTSRQLSINTYLVISPLGKKVGHRNFTFNYLSDTAYTRAYEDRDYFGRVTFKEDMGRRVYRYYYDFEGKLIYELGDTEQEKEVWMAGLYGQLDINQQKVDLKAALYDGLEFSDANHEFNFLKAVEDNLRPQAGATGPFLEKFIKHEYYRNGLERRIIDYNNKKTVPVGANPPNTIEAFTRYQYDDWGRVTLEEYGEAERKLDGSGGISALYSAIQTAEVTYDNAGRILSIEDRNLFKLKYEYDAVGNRRHIYARYAHGVYGQVDEQDLWYTYDGLNRMKIVLGEIKDSTGVSPYTTMTGANGDPIYWDEQLELLRKSETPPQLQLVRGQGYEIGYSLDNDRRTLSYKADGGVENIEDYTYDDSGHLQWVYLTSNGVKDPVSFRRYDTYGRVKEYREFRRPVNTLQASLDQWNISRIRNENGEVIDYINTSLHSYTYIGNKLNVDTDNTYSANYITTTESTGPDEVETISRQNKGAVGETDYAYDQYGNITSVKFQAPGEQFRPTTYYNYTLWDDFKKAAHIIQPYHPDVVNNEDWEAGYSSFSYNSSGQLLEVANVKGGRYINYFTNQAGQILRRSEYDIPTVGNQYYGTYYYFYFQGKTIGELSDRFHKRTDYASMLADLDGNGVIDANDNKIEGKGDNATFDLKPIASKISPLNTADFDQNYVPISPTYPTIAPSTYVLTQQDATNSSWSSVAESVFGDPSLGYILENANPQVGGLNSDYQWAAGIKIVIPNVVTNIHNNKDTFKPYNPGELMGNTAPVIPDPPKPPQPTLTMQVVSAVITAVLTFFLGPVGAMIGNYLTQAYYKKHGYIKEIDEQAIGEAGVKAIIAQAIFGGGEGAGGAESGAEGGTASIGSDTAGAATSAGGAGVSSGVAGGTASGAASGAGAASTSIWQEIGKAALQNAIGQVIDVEITKKQKDYDGTSLLLSVAVAAIGYETNVKGTDTYKGLSSAGRKLALTAHGVAMSVVRQQLSRLVYSNYKFDWSAVAGDTVTAALNANKTVNQDEELAISKACGVPQKPASPKRNSTIYDDNTVSDKPLYYPDLSQIPTNTPEENSSNIYSSRYSLTRGDVSLTDLNQKTSDSLFGSSTYSSSNYDDTELDIQYLEATRDRSLEGTLNTGNLQPPVRNAKVTSEQIMGLQYSLESLGYHPGPMNGIVGPNTLKALNAFYADKSWKTPSVVDESVVSLVTQSYDISQQYDAQTLHDHEVMTHYTTFSTGGGEGSLEKAWRERNLPDTGRALGNVGVDTGNFLLDGLFNILPAPIKWARDSFFKDQTTIPSFEYDSPIFGKYAHGTFTIGSMFVSAPSLERGLAKGFGKVVPDSRKFDFVNQGTAVDSNGFKYTEGLSSHVSVAELMQSGALPGTKGVTLTDRTIRFGDLYELGTLNGRRMEFALTTERVDGKLVKRLYSGDAWVSPVPKDSRLIGHVHPNETATQIWPSPGDINTVNARYFRQLQLDTTARPQPTRIFWGPGNTDNTIFYPGFGKTPLLGGSKY